MSHLTRMARQLLAIDEDIQFRIKDPYKYKVDDFDMHTFVQAFADTSCGFGGIAGQSITKENVYVFLPLCNETEECIVYIGSRYAYSVPYSRLFIDDVNRSRVATLSEKGKYNVE